MSNEELALALTEVAVKTGIILSSLQELPYNSEGINSKSYDEIASDMVAFYKAALKIISEK